MHMKNNKRWTSLKLALFVPVVALLLQAFAEPELIVKKAEVYLPVIAQQDSSEIWINSWVSSQMKILTDENYLSTASSGNISQVTNSVDYNVSTFDSNTINKNNLLVILQNSKGELLVDRERYEWKDLRPIVESFLKGKNTITGKFSDFKETELPLVGKVRISEGVIMFRMDLKNPKIMAEKAMKPIAEALLNVRKDVAREKFGKDYFSLSRDKREVINQLIPERINLGNPKKTSAAALLLPPVNLKLVKDGELFVGEYVYPKQELKWGKTITKQELRDYIEKGRLHAAEKTKEYNRKYQQQVLVLVEVGVNDRQVNELKEFLSSLDNLRVVFSTDRTEEEFGVGLSSSLKSEKSNTVSQSENLSFIPPPFIIPIKSDGSFGAQFKNLNELKASLEKHRRWYFEYESKGKPTSTITFIAEAGITNDQIDAVKDMLGKVQINDVRFATQLDPARISLKNNGDYIYHNERYDFPAEIKEQLIEQKNMVEKWNRQNGTQFDFNVNIMVEDGVSKSKVSEMRELLRSMKILNINYSSENSSENIKQGSSTDYLNRFDQYDVVVTSDNLQAFNKVCTVEEVKQEVEDSYKTLDNKKTISVLAFSDVSKERLDAVLNELNQIPFKKVSTTVLTKEQKPVSLAQHKVLLKENGKINIDSKEYDLNEFQSRINEIGSQSSKTNVAFEVEDNVTYIQIETVKQMLREANIDQVGYSIHKHYVRDTEPGTKIGEESTMFWTTWSGAPDLERVKRAAENFLSGKGNRSLYAGITPDKNATEEDIDAVKQVLQDAGFQSVSIRESRN